MDQYHLVIVDTTGIQSYIFGSNRLRENVGASFLVHQATELDKYRVRRRIQWRV